MNRSRGSLTALAVLGVACLVLVWTGGRPAGATPPGETPEAPSSHPVQKPAYGEGGGGGYADRSKLPDSFRYYGPNGLWARWDAEQRFGRNTWMFYTGSNQKFYRILARFLGTNGISVDFYRLLDSKRRPDRFRTLGVVNEPNFTQAADKETDEYGFRVDRWQGDPEGCYDEATGQALGRHGEPLADPAGKTGAYPWNPRWYGEPTGIIGLRKFPNPAFTEAQRKNWKADPAKSVRAYFKDPGRTEPPYVFGITCAFCHVAFDPLNPPRDPANPRWENLAANIGNQYFREGDIFFGAGRIVGGDANPGSAYNQGDGDPYDTRGLGEESFLYQYGHTQQPGTSETSRFSYDFINNPNTINQIINIGNRRDFVETAPNGEAVITKHILKDGADSVGLKTALLRVFVNIGSEGDYWADHLWNPLAGTPQSPFQLREVRGNVPAERSRALRRSYPELGDAWNETEGRVDALVRYLASYTPYSLKGAIDKDGRPYLSQDAAQLRRGTELFVQHCARCHSNDQPSYPQSMDADPLVYYRRKFAAPGFPAGNTFSDDVRYPFNLEGLGLNAARALATNAVDNDIWADLSSKDYKALPPLRTVQFENPLHMLDPGRFGSSPVVTEFTAPGGGRGYYRTASLNSMWATAPFLHNNSVGVDPVDDQGRIDPRFLTIAGRLELFETAMDQLLNPEKRPLRIKVTSSECGLIGALPGIRARAAETIRGLAKERLHEIIEAAVSQTIDTFDLPEADRPLRPLIKKGLLDLLVVFRPVFDDLYTKQNLEKVKATVIDTVHAKVDDVIRQELQGRPNLAALVGKLKPKFDAELKKRMTDLTELVPQDLVVPKGTPINLVLNLNAGRAPYALKFYLKNRTNERLVVEELLRLSDCPDLVENRGHTFGSELKTAEKRDLVEFLKTL
jgi:hypothetical protein